jgi:hydroxymethylbilane synthase
MSTYKIGTRGSLLAVTQSTLVMNELKRLSGESFELVLIKTQGDEITNKPLWQLEGKDFFTKELDEALLGNKVDFVIHSYKDLGSIRPEGIKLAAITERRFAQDILLIHKDTIKKLQDWQGDFVVGTSSPRRIVNLTCHLQEYLPYGKRNQLGIKCEMLRGNVNTRIKKLKDGQYHAITLALAGIERLAHGDESSKELKELLSGLDYFILPQSVFPAAASQGALGIEMSAHREDGGKLANLLSKLSHQRTMDEVARERKAFQEFGGGCHLAVGIHVKKIGDHFLHVHAGEVDGKRIERKWMEGSELPMVKNKKIFVGLPRGEGPYIYDQWLKKVPETKTLNFTGKQVFVTSRYCLPTLFNSSAPAGVWAAGTRTAKELAAEGIWVNGTADSLGTEDLKQFSESRALAFFHAFSDWTILSHQDASSDLGTVEGCYARVEQEFSEDWLKKLEEVDVCYWTSFPQFESYVKKFPFITKKIHCCGLGKTWQEFKKANVPVHPVASMQALEKALEE